MLKQYSMFGPLLKFNELLTFCLNIHCFTSKHMFFFPPSGKFHLNPFISEANKIQKEFIGAEILYHNIMHCVIVHKPVPIATFLLYLVKGVKSMCTLSHTWKYYKSMNKKQIWEISLIKADLRQSTRRERTLPRMPRPPVNAVATPPTQ